jgi:hypothetical protein
VGEIPPDSTNWEVYSLTDRYVELDQRCKQSIGQLMAVYPSNPYATSSTQDCVPKLTFGQSERGIEVLGGGSVTVFLHYKLRPTKFTSEVFDPVRAYKAGDLTYSTTLKDCFRALQDVTAIAPDASNAAAYWVLVPLPYVLSDYIAYSVAADLADSAGEKIGFANDAQTMLVRETDKTIEQDPSQRVRYTLVRPRSSRWLLPTLATDTTPGAALTTLTDQCVTGYGEPK